MTDEPLFDTASDDEEEEEEEAGESSGSVRQRQRQRQRGGAPPPSKLPVEGPGGYAAMLDMKTSELRWIAGPAVEVRVCCKCVWLMCVLNVCVFK